MAIKKVVFKTTSEDQGKRLDLFLSEKMKLSRNQAKELIQSGAVYLNNSRVRMESKKLFSNVQVDIYQDNRPKSKIQLPIPINIIFEDNDLIAVDKPSGIPSQATVADAENNMYEALKKFIKTRDGQESLALHHRLDKDTSGILLFAKTKNGNLLLADAFKNRTMQKTYIAIVHRPPVLPQQTWEVINHLGRMKGEKNKFCSVKSGGDFAHSSFELVANNERALWILCHPHTGRSHQLRVHLSESNMPIWGDRIYRHFSQQACPRLLLHALQLEIKKPDCDQALVIEAPVPSIFKNFFSQNT